MGLIERIKEAVVSAAKKGGEEAYAAGYEDASERCYKLYCMGMQRGLEMALMEEAEIDLDGIEELDEELDPSVFGEVEA